MFEDREPLVLEPCPDCHVLTDGSGCLCSEDSERDYEDLDEPDVDDDFPMYLEYNDWQDDGRYEPAEMDF